MIFGGLVFKATRYLDRTALYVVVVVHVLLLILVLVLLLIIIIISTLRSK